MSLQQLALSKIQHARFGEVGSENPQHACVRGHEWDRGQCTKLLNRVACEIVVE